MAFFSATRVNFDIWHFTKEQDLLGKVHGENVGGQYSLIDSQVAMHDQHFGLVLPSMIFNGNIWSNI